MKKTIITDYVGDNFNNDMSLLESYLKLNENAKIISTSGGSGRGMIVFETESQIDKIELKMRIEGHLKKENLSSIQVMKIHNCVLL